MLNLNGSPRILVVDGNNVMRRLLAVSIINKGLQVTTAATAAEARHFMQDQDYDVVVTDADLSDMNGYELIHTLKSANRNLKVMVMGKGIFSEKPALLKGALDTIVKPFSNSEFLLKLDMVLNDKRKTARFRSRDLFCRITGDADSPVEGIVDNLSFDGALIDTENDAAGEDSVGIEFLDPGSGDAVGSVKGHIIRRLHDSGRFQYQLAVYFKPDEGQLGLMTALLPYIEEKL